MSRLQTFQHRVAIANVKAASVSRLNTCHVLPYEQGRNNKIKPPNALNGAANIAYQIRLMYIHFVISDFETPYSVK